MRAGELVWLQHQRQRWLRPDAERYLRSDAARWMRSDLLQLLQPPPCERKYRPDQPRVPAGNPDGGQWTTEERLAGNEEQSFNGESSLVELSAVRRRSRRALEAYCLAQYARDTFHCTMVGSRACHEQAALRYANCLTNKPIPPLNY